MKTLLFVVLPDANAPAQPYDTHAIDTLRSMFKQHMSSYGVTTVAYWGGELASKYGVTLPMTQVRYILEVPKKDTGNLRLILQTLVPTFTHDEFVLCVAPQGFATACVIKGLIKKCSGDNITDTVCELMGSISHGAFLFTSERKGVPVIVTFPPKIE